MGVGWALVVAIQYLYALYEHLVSRPATIILGLF